MPKKRPPPPAYIPYTNNDPKDKKKCRCRVCGGQFWAEIERNVCSIDCRRQEGK